MTFEKAVERVLAYEGGWVQHENDPGGETKYGISKRAYPDVDIKNLTIDQAKQIYLRDYWNKLQLDRLPDEIRFDLFDAAVNSGLTTAAKLLQRACNVQDDGIIGSRTVAAANSINPQILDKRLSGYRLLYICDIKTFPTFGRGWVRRVANNLIED